MKFWIREWLWIDIIALGIGTVLLFGYIFRFDYFSGNTPQANLIPNFATEILGVWLSVRIIDQLLRRRQRYHDRRKALIDDLVMVRHQLDLFFPASRYASIETLERSQGWINEKMGDYLPYLSAVEREEALRNQNLAQKAVDLCREFHLLLEENLQAKQEVRDISLNLKLARTPLIDLIRTFRFESFSQLLEEPASLSHWAEILTKVLNESENALAANEHQVISELCRQISVDRVFTHRDIDDLTREASRFEASIWYGDVLWNSQLDNACDLIAINPIETIEKWEVFLESAKVDILNNQESYPDLLHHAGEYYLNSTTKLSVTGLEACLSIDEYDEAFDRIRRMIEKESP